MKTPLSITLVSFLLLSLSSLNASGQQKAVFIIVDGIPTDVIEKLKPTTLTEIASTGGFAKAFVGGEKGGVSESPTISAVGYNHVLTGTWTHKHNVWDNDIKAQNYNYWNVFRIVKQANPKNTTAIFSTWQDNRTKLVGDNLPQAGNVKVDYAFDGFELDTVRFPHRKGAKHISDIDSLVANEAARYIKANGPDLSWVYLEFTDDMGHAYGDSPQFYDAIHKADHYVSMVWSAVKERQLKFKEDWMIVITTDHGRDAETGKNHGGQSDRERNTWIVTNAKGLNSHFSNGLAAVDIAPTLLRHLHITVPESIREEMDGTAFIGKNSLTQLKATRQANTIALTWESEQATSGNVQILMSMTNNYQHGGKDTYVKVGTARVADKTFTIDISKYPSDFYKILVKGKDNYANAWIASKK